MKTLLTTACAAVGVCLSVAGSSWALDGWCEDFSKGMEMAKEGKRTALVEFTGTDWCFYCIKLRENVFPTTEFNDFVKKNNLVLIELDFPNAKDKVTPEQRAVREGLAQKYNVQGFPTVFVMDGDGQAYGRVVGGSSTPGEYIARLQKALDDKAAYEEKVAAAKKLTGAERLAALLAVYNALPQDSRATHVKLVEAIIESDPEDTTGMRKNRDESELNKKQLDDVKAAIEAAMNGRSFNEAAADVRTALLDQLKREDLIPFVRLSVNVLICQSHLGEGNLNEALKYMDAAIEASPDSKEAEHMRTKGRPELLKLIENSKQ